MLMWHVSLTMLAMIFAGIALFASVRSMQHADRASEQSRELGSLSSAVAQLELQTARNTETLRKLSGVIYKRKQQGEEPDGTAPDRPVELADRANYKAKLREKLGLTKRVS